MTFSTFLFRWRDFLSANARMIYLTMLDYPLGVLISVDVKMGLLLVRHVLVEFLLYLVSLKAQEVQAH